MYRFSGIIREQLWFMSPNICAAFLVLSIIISLGIVITLFDRKGYLFKFTGIFISLFTLLQLYYLLATYSRGGYVALTLSLFALYFLTGRKKSVLISSVIWIICLLAFPQSATRVESIGAVTNDGAIYHRLLAWLGGMKIIAGNAPSGGVPLCGNEYTAWFQPLGLNEQYTTLMNDFLNLCCTHGILLAWLIVIVLFVIIYLGVKIRTQFDHNLLAILLAALLGYLVCGMFSTITPALGGYFLGISGLIVFFIIYAIFKRKLILKYQLFLIPTLSATFLMIIFAVTCDIVSHIAPYQYQRYQWSTSGVSFSCVEVIPNHVEPQATLLTIMDMDQDPIFVRKILRPLIEQKHFRTITMQCPLDFKNQSRIKEWLLTRCAENTAKVRFLLTTGSVGQQLWAAACDMPNLPNTYIVIYDLPEYSRFPEYHPSLYVESLSLPVIWIAGKSEIIKSPLYQQLITTGKTIILLDSLSFL